MRSYENCHYQMENGLERKHSFCSVSKFKKEKEAAKKHTVAEQWRRWRINGHYKKLREMLQTHMTSKMVKASILTETVRYVKALKKRADEVGLLRDDEGWFRGGGATSLPSIFPGECNEATVCPQNIDKGIMVKATVCCEDRPGLNQELTDAIRKTGGVAMGAEMATVGGRKVVEVVVRWPEGGGGEEVVRALRRDLRGLVDNRCMGYNELGQLLGVDGYGGLGLERPINIPAMVGGSFNSNWEWDDILS